MKQDKDKLIRNNIKFVNALQTSHFFWSRVFKRLGHHNTKRFMIFFKKNTNSHNESLRSYVESVHERLAGMHSEDSIWELWSVHLKLKVATRVYSGLRYRFGLPTRGQRTRSNNKTIGYFCRVRVRKNINYSAQKKKRDDLVTSGLKKSKDKSSSTYAGGKFGDKTALTHLYDEVYAERLSFLGSVTSLRFSFVQNKNNFLNKDFFRSFKQQSRDYLSVSKRRKRFRTRFWWLRKQKAKSWKIANNRQKAYQRYLSKVSQTKSGNSSKDMRELTHQYNAKASKVKILPFDQFLTPVEKKRLATKQREDQRYKVLGKLLQDIKLKWVYFKIFGCFLTIKDRVGVDGLNQRFLDLKPCGSIFKDSWTYLLWPNSGPFNKRIEEGKDKKEYIQKEKVRLSAKRADPNNFLNIKHSKSVKRSDQIRQKTLNLKLRKHKLSVERASRIKARQGFSM